MLGTMVEADSLTELAGLLESSFWNTSSDALRVIATSTVSLKISVTLPESMFIKNWRSRGLVVSLVYISTC